MSTPRIIAKLVEAGHQDLAEQLCVAGRPLKSIVRSLDVTIDEMETDPDFRKGDVRDASPYVGNLRATAKELGQLGARQFGPSIKELTNRAQDLENVAKRKGAVPQAHFKALIKSLKGTLRDLQALSEGKVDDDNLAEAGRWAALVSNQLREIENSLAHIRHQMAGPPGSATLLDVGSVMDALANVVDDATDAMIAAGTEVASIKGTNAIKSVKAQAKKIGDIVSKVNKLVSDYIDNEGNWE